MQFEMNPVVLDENTLQSYAGNYEDRIITFENGKLFYERKGRPKFQLYPASVDTFWLKDMDYFRVRFEKDASGKVTGLIGLDDDGHTDKSVRN